MIKILIVDDSKTETLLLKSIFEAEEDMQVIGCAANGKEAVRLTALLKPDLITMDLVMPLLDGFEATRLIMSSHPTPIIIISSRLDDSALNASFKALAAGALCLIEKPDQANTSFLTLKKRITETVRSMAEIKVIKRRFQAPSKTKKNLSLPVHPELKAEPFEIIAIGSSVGGPQALKTIFSNLAADFPVPIVVVQHMTQGFIQGFTQWLNKHVRPRVKEAENLELLVPGTIYFAPDKYHLEVIRKHGALYAKLTHGLPVSGFYPSATVLLKSVAKVSANHAIGILLTGMGSDGALGLLDMKNAQAYTFTQDEQSAVVFGMAGVAHSLGATNRMIELDKIAEHLISIIQKQAAAAKID
ncbi:MAG TPA: chemotaxis-specific protein-glutamate methyltransferase CheB [Gammaproteobacteria bacterium]|nr:chemotaxis-specific protein-glutamate methyltransferase CheB [Gammaproteobacteria bacterium]